MRDKEVLDHIQQLVEDEHELLQRGTDRDLTEEEHERLRAMGISLDQCWDLLRQRRAKREFGADPDDARPRDPTTVERYEQ